LFISEVKVGAFSVNHLPTVQPPAFTRTQILYARSQQSFHSRPINLCSRWPRYTQPRSHSSLPWLPASNPLVQYENFLIKFIFRLGL